MASFRYIEEAVTIELDAEKCTGCRRCLEVCPHRVFGIEEGVAYFADRGACIECGACERNCASGAITVDAGVGCAAAIINGWLRGTEPTCGDAGSCC